MIGYGVDAGPVVNETPFGIATAAAMATRTTRDYPGGGGGEEYDNEK